MVSIGGQKLDTEGVQGKSRKTRVNQAQHLTKKNPEEKAHKKLDKVERNIAPANKQLERHKKKQAKKEEKAALLNSSVTTEKRENRGRRPVDKTPTWDRYYRMRRIPKSILDIVKDRLTYDDNIQAYTALIKSNELLEELSSQYKGVNNTTINTAFYRLKDAGWFEDVISYTGPESDRTVVMDPALIMTAEELETLKQSKAHSSH